MPVILNWDAKDREKAVNLKRKRTSCDDVPWTAARCNRLLRSIDSRIAILNGLARSHSTSRVRAKLDSNFQVAKHQKRQSSRSEGDHTPAKNKIIKNAANDPEWLPDTIPRVGRRTYGSKIRLEADTQPLRRKTFKFPTPFVRRILQPSQTGNYTSESDVAPSKNSRQAARLRKTRQLPIKATNSGDEAQRNLKTAFESVLQQTKPETESRIGAASLRSMCARHVPKYIELEREFAREQNETYLNDGGKFTPTIYSHLEDRFGLGRGWMELRNVVRAHAVHKVCATISDGTLSGVVIESMIDLCRVNEAVNEAQLLLQAHLRRGGDCISALRKLSKFADEKEAQSLFLKTLRLVLTSDLQPKLDISLLPAHFWSQVVAAFNKLNDNFEAEEIVVALFQQMLRSSDQAMAVGTSTVPGSSTILRKILILMSTMATTCTTEVHDNACSQERLIRSIQRALFGLVFAQQMASPTIKSKRACRLIAQSALISSLLIKAISSSENENLVIMGLDQIVSVIRAQQSSTEDAPPLPNMIRDITTCLSRVDDSFARNSCESLIGRLLAACDNVSKTNYHVLQGVALDAAEDYAKSYPDCRSKAFLLQTESKLCQRPSTRIVQNPTSPKNEESGFMWDDTICEFIAMTPLASLVERPGPIEESITRPAPPIMLANISWGVKGQTCSSGKTERPVSPTTRKIKLSRVSFHQSPSKEEVSPSRTIVPILADRSINIPTHSTLARSIPCESKQPGCKIRKKFKRSASAVALGQENNTSEDERDELGVLTPAHLKKKRRLSILDSHIGFGRSRSLVGISSLDDLSDDELGQ